MIGVNFPNYPIGELTEQPMRRLTFFGIFLLCYYYLLPEIIDNYILHFYTAPTQI